MSESIPSAVLLFLIVAVAEVIALTTWWPQVYRSGFVVFRQSIPVSRPAALEPRALEAKFLKRGKPALLVRSIGDREIGFRLPGALNAAFHLASVLHGHAVYRPESSDVLVSGRLNWSILVFFACLPYAVRDLFSEEVTILMVMPLLLWSLLIFWAERRFVNRVAGEIATRNFDGA